MKRRRYRWLLVLIFAAAILGWASNAYRPPAPGSSVSTRGNRSLVAASHVLVVMNARSADSRAVAEYYIGRRGIPAANILRLDCPDTDEISRIDYQTRIESFVQAYARRFPDTDAVVLTRGVPFRFSDFGASGGYSVDSVLSTCLLQPRPTAKMANPYYGKSERFARRAFGLLLVTRLDGPTLEDAKRLVDSSVAARPLSGPFYLRDSFCLSMREAAALLVQRGFLVEWIEGYNNPKYPHYQGSGGPFMAHWGAGPHDTQYSEAEYRAMRFYPGAIGELTWSVSAADIHRPDSQGVITAMCANGAAGAQGYVSEPYTDSLGRPEIVLDRYTRGYTLAESFYAGAPYVHWKNLVLGDPLCAPYAAH